ncbi:MAG: hypothetical protein HC902_11725 [Calothrix sp. SM1_5_4]|nr:hypothetical protein [Calothrix sp. SM1_5_4]
MVGAEEIKTKVLPPSWRKATRNMILATLAMEQALAVAPGAAAAISAFGEGALIVGTNSGELETSADFLTTWSRMKMARPVLFQNSLHNATAGFAAIRFGLTGPSLTVSSGESTPGECLRLADDLLREGMCRACLVTLVEVHKALADLIEVEVGEGAVSLLLTDASTAAARGWTVRAELSEPSWFEPYPRADDRAPLFDIRSSEFYRRAAAL